LEGEGEGKRGDPFPSFGCFRNEVGGRGINIFSIFFGCFRRRKWEGNGHIN
jgi:hypothetical protein